METCWRPIPTLIAHLAAPRGSGDFVLFSGHVGSAWYADTFWQELHDGCVAHVNVDSVGAKGATLLSEAIAMAEVRGVASDAVEKVSGQRLSGARPQRAGDQS